MKLQRYWKEYWKEILNENRLAKRIRKSWRRPRDTLSNPLLSFPKIVGFPLPAPAASPHVTAHPPGCRRYGWDRGRQFPDRTLPGKFRVPPLAIAQVESDPSGGLPAGISTPVTAHECTARYRCLEIKAHVRRRLNRNTVLGNVWETGNEPGRT